LSLNESFLELIFIEALMPENQQKVDVISCLIKSLFLPGVSTHLITNVTIFVGEEGHFAVWRKSESICNKLSHVRLGPLLLLLFGKPCPEAFSPILGQIWQDVNIVATVILSIKSTNILQVTDILSCVLDYRMEHLVCASFAQAREHHNKKRKRSMLILLGKAARV
jgi:hypothetical protein